MNRIDSASNGRIKELAKLAASASLRKEEGVMILPGPKLCLDAASCGIRILELYATDEAQEKYSEAWEKLRPLAGSAATVSLEADRKAEGQKTPQGIFAVAAMPGEASIEEISSSDRVLALAGVQDPGNVGTMLRTAAAFGFEYALLGPGTADVFSEKVMRASMGSVFRVGTRRSQDLGQDLDLLRAAGARTVGAVLSSDSVPPEEIPAAGRLVLVIGSEGRGMPPEIEKRLDIRTTIPMRAQVESLNAASAAAVLMWMLRK
ncbi:MAG: TrmH family RNA methyltransferase [Oscillospiraceae bacterium]|jgi:TrmH family RNA methyltransferase